MSLDSSAASLSAASWLSSELLRELPDSAAAGSAWGSSTIAPVLSHTLPGSAATKRVPQASLELAVSEPPSAAPAKRASVSAA